MIADRRGHRHRARNGLPVMQRVYIKGLVRVADTVRRSLALPLSQEKMAEIRRLVTDSLAQVNGILAEKHATVANLPAPSRRAYEFLANVDFEAGVAPSAGEHATRPGGTVTMRGLTAFWEGVLGQLGQPIGDSHADEIRDVIVKTSADIERYLTNHHLRTEDLMRPSREAYAWLRFFADRTNFAVYVSAVRTAHPILRAAMSAIPRHQADLLVEFRPMTGLYRVRGYADATRVVLPTPMISFDEPLFRALAAAMFGNGSKQTVMEAARSEPYQTIQAELDALGGVVERTAGVHHDLVQSFDRVASQYLDGEVSRPRLTWNRTLTGRKFGHYDPLTDTVMISCTLDHADVPDFVVDFVMYHELLHKKLGVDWRNGRQEVHTAEFRRWEALFARSAAAELMLKKIAMQHA
jgi:hypothetical protein